MAAKPGTGARPSAGNPAAADADVDPDGVEMVGGQNRVWPDFVHKGFAQRAEPGRTPELRVEPGIVRTDPLKLKEGPASITRELAQAILSACEVQSTKDTYQRLTDLTFRAMNIYIDDLQGQHPKKEDAALAVVRYAWRGGKIFALLSTAVTVYPNESALWRFVHQYVPQLWPDARLQQVRNALVRTWTVEQMAAACKEVGMPVPPQSQLTGASSQDMAVYVTKTAKDHDKLGALITHLREKIPAALAAQGI